MHHHLWEPQRHWRYATIGPFPSRGNGSSQVVRCEMTVAREAAYAPADGILTLNAEGTRKERRACVLKVGPNRRAKFSPTLPSYFAPRPG
jgi:hypothetical protein